jgi:hypothetical protein
VIKQLLEPRSDVLAGRLQGVIDIERVADPKHRALESRARDFFAATFVSGEIRQLVTGLNQRLNSSEAETGSFLAEGPKGVGKSHGLLIPLHLLNSIGELQAWLVANGLEFSVPAGTRVIWRKFTDFPLESLWGVIAQELGVSFRRDQPPDINEFRYAVGENKLVVIFDELESGIRAISDPALKQRNLNFLQMISEEANRAGSNIVLIASIYDGNQEPGQTLKRVARVELRFQDSSDRRKILFHRLFTTSPLAPSPEIDTVVQSYLNIWRRFGVEIPPDYPDQLRESFPFTPELLDVALVRIRQAKGGFQGTRGTLGFLAALVRARCESAHLLTLADASILDSELRSWLADLDPSQNLLTCADSNLRELRQNPFADRIASAVLLTSLAPSPKEPGITEDELARQVIAPDSDYNAFRISLTKFRKLGSYFHERGGSFHFDTKENAHSKVNLRSLSISDEDAWDKVASWWCADLLRDQDAVVFSDPVATRQTIDARPSADVRLVIAPRKLSNDQIHEFYFGLKRRNTIILVEPRDERIDLRTNGDLLKYAKTWLAADYLARNAGDAIKTQEFTRIGTDDKKNALDSLRKTNFAFVQVVRYGATPSDCDFQRESLPSAASREQIVQHILRTLYPGSRVQEHLAERASELIGKKVSQIEADYRNTLEFPMLLSHSVFQEAICALTEEGNIIGLRHPSYPGGGICGRRPPSGDFIGEAVISSPFDATSTPSPSRPSRPPLPTPEGFPSPIPTPPPTESEILQTTFLQSRQQIRQEIARLLEPHETRKVAKVRFALTFDERQTDIGSLPSFLRGSLSGPGKFEGEAAIEFSVSSSKAQVEEMVERLPDFVPGSCRVTITLQTPQ